uniref:Rab-GAP TBC domain-containing protein n=1 Tax=Palpitomonas bilix TaxID=652834 RepID=A0A7S3G4N9_9EUKA|mmetsp:Transcript_21502/g.55849  ORF Transcript_21502/g.55849 Transcript_21502/m.55849 type:complete len:294 (+) Transcript_21502:328-1209(+)
MSSTESTYREILGQEIFVDVRRLRDLARHGVPPSLRDEVWKYLLAVLKPDKSEEYSQLRSVQKEYDSLRVLNESTRQSAFRDFDELKGVKQHFKTAKEGAEYLNLREKVANVVSAICQQPAGVQYSRSLVPLVVPFCLTMRLEADAYYSSFALLRLAGERCIEREGLLEEFSQFLTLFRVMFPDLNEWFDTEMISPNEWALSWFQTLLARELTPDLTQRLWDTYFAGPDGLKLHTFVCLSVVQVLEDSLLQMDREDILLVLHNLPRISVDELIIRARNLKADCASRSLYPFRT